MSAMPSFIRRGLLFLLICANTACADLIIVQEVDSEVMGLQTLTHSFKNGKVRLDSEATSVICDFAKQESISILKAQKLVMRSRLPAAPAAIGAAVQAAVNGVGDSNRPRKTGQTAMIDGRFCEAWDWKNQFTEVTCWVAQDYPGFAKFQEEIKKLGKAEGAMIAFAAGGEEMNGMVIRIEALTIATKQRTIMTLKSLKFDPIDDSVFAVPEGYKEMKLGQ
jgi:hypothetical protein